MPTILITADYSGWARYNELDGAYSKYVNDPVNYPYSGIGFWANKGYICHDRPFLRFPLDDLPSGVTVTQLRVRALCNRAGGLQHATDIHGYGLAGQEDPEPDDEPTCYNRCASGNLYVDDSDALLTTGEKWFTLGGSACQDVMNAKSAVNRFSLGLHEEGDNDPYALLQAFEDSVGSFRLEITHEEAAVGYHYSDGLVSIQVAGS